MKILLQRLMTPYATYPMLRVEFDDGSYYVLPQQWCATPPTIPAFKFPMVKHLG